MSTPETGPADVDRPAWYRSRAGRFSLAGYGLLVLAVVSSLLYTRSRVLIELGTPEALAEWRAWQDEVRQQQQSNAGATERRVPTSDEPPQLVLLRDYFPGVLVGTLVILSFLYAFLAFVTVGMMRQRE